LVCIIADGMGRRKSKKDTMNCLRAPRGARGSMRNRTETKSFEYHDLNIPVPPSKSSKALEDIVDRLSSINTSVAALSHTVYGRPTPDRDGAKKTLEPIIKSLLSPIKRKRNTDDSQGNTKKDMTLFKRLSVVIEDLSEIIHYNEENKKNTTMLDEYDLVSVSPRNDTVFSAACLCPSFHIINLDYSVRGPLLFRLRSNDIAVATERGAVFELDYAPAIVDPSKRKFFIRAAREFLAASANVRNPKPTLIISSGSRVGQDSSDFGSMALRTPGDLSNLVQILLGFDVKYANTVMSTVAATVLENIRQRKTSATGINEKCRKRKHRFVQVYPVEGNFKDVPLVGDTSFQVKSDKASDERVSNDKNDEDMVALDDGFIAL